MILPVLQGTLLDFAVLFGVIFVDSLGVPGGTVTLISTGALATGYGQLSLIVLIGTCAASMGDFAAYLIAFFFYEHLSPWLGRFKVYKNNEKKVRQQLNDSAFSLVFFTRWFLAAGGTVVSYICGFERIDKKKFLTAAVLGDAVYAMVFPVLGYSFREIWYDIADVVGNTLTVLLLIVIAGIALRYYLAYRARHRE